MVLLQRRVKALNKNSILHNINYRTNVIISKIANRIFSVLFYIVADMMPLGSYR
jgi:ABC-type uncharacterized transport system permease subunit